MYSLTICFGPSATTWSLIFKEEVKAGEVYNAYVDNKVSATESDILIGSDDFGQSYAILFADIHGILLEDLELAQELRILRSLDNARGEVKARQRATTDPVIRAASQGPAVLQPRFNG